MARIDSLKASFRRCRGTYKYSDFKNMIEKMGYGLVVMSGGSRGSRRRFHNKETNHLITLDEPHDGVMTFGMIKRLRDDLLERGAL